MRYWHADSFSFLSAAAKSEQSIWIATLGPAKAVHCVNLFTLKCFTLSVFIPLHSCLFAPKNHIHDQTWPDPIKLMPQNSSAMPQRWEQRRRRSPFSLLTVSGWRRHLADGWDKPDVITDLWAKSCLFLVWSEATGPGLHSQVPEQNWRNPSGLNKTQNHRLQTCMKRGSGFQLNLTFFVFFSHLSKDWNMFKVILLDNSNTKQDAVDTFGLVGSVIGLVPVGNVHSYFHMFSSLCVSFHVSCQDRSIKG